MFRCILFPFFMLTLPPAKRLQALNIDHVAQLSPSIKTYASNTRRRVINFKQGLRIEWLRTSRISFCLWLELLHISASDIMPGATERLRS
jgi:hypothetical protein